MTKHRKITLLAVALCSSAFLMTACNTSSDGSFPTFSSGNGASTTLGKIQTTLNRALPAGTSKVQLIGLDANNQQVYIYETGPSASLVAENVPLTVKTWRVVFLNGTTPVAQGSYAVSVAANQTSVVLNPFWDIVINNVGSSFLAGTYQITGGDSGTVKGGLLSGQLVFDGAGKISSGTLVRTSADGLDTATNFNVTSGTYTINANRDVTVTLTTDRFPVTLRGRASLNSLGQTVFCSAAGDNGANDALAGFVELQKLDVGGKVTDGTYHLSGLNVGILGTPGFYYGTVTLKAGTIGGSFKSPTGNSLSITGGNFAVGANGSLTGTMNVNGLGAVTFNGSTGADGTVSLDARAASGDRIYLAGLPVVTGFTSPNVPTEMSATGMRGVTGGFNGLLTLSVGAGQILGGTLSEQNATQVPIQVVDESVGAGSFSLDSQTGLVTGKQEGAGAVRLVEGIFSPDGSAYIGTLDNGLGGLAGGQSFAVLVK